MGPNVGSPKETNHRGNRTIVVQQTSSGHATEMVKKHGIRHGMGKGMAKWAKIHSSVVTKKLVKSGKRGIGRTQDSMVCRGKEP
jgi:hypothetical protein